MYIFSLVTTYSQNAYYRLDNNKDYIFPIISSSHWMVLTNIDSEEDIYSTSHCAEGYFNFSNPEAVPNSRNWLVYESFDSDYYIQHNQDMQFYANEFLKYVHKYAGKFWKICGSNMQRYAILCNNMHCIKMHKNKTNMQLHRFAYPEHNAFFQ